MLFDGSKQDEHITQNRVELVSHVRAFFCTAFSYTDVRMRGRVRTRLSVHQVVFCMTERVTNCPLVSRNYCRVKLVSFEMSVTFISTTITFHLSSLNILT